MHEENYIDQIIEILNQPMTLTEKQTQLEDYHDYEIARAFLVMDQSTKEMLYKVLPPKDLADVFEELEPEDAFAILEATSLSVITNVFRYMEVDDLVDIIELVDDDEDRITYLSLIDVKKRISVKQLLAFDEDVVGSLMTTSFIEIHPTDTVKQAIRHVVELAPDVEYINNIYVSDNDQLVGALSLKELISAGNEKTQSVSELMSENVISVQPSTLNEDALVLMQNYDFQLLPVVDKYNKLIGVISFDDMIEQLSYESDQDYSSLAGLSDVVLNDKESVWQTIKKRLPWLVFLLFVNLITSRIIASYESTLILLPTLAIFMPLILNMAGNSGTQSLGIVIRLFAKNELDDRASVFRHLFNEFLTGVVNGLVIAICLFAMVMLFNLMRSVPIEEGLRFAFVIALSINVALIVSTLAGTLIPLLINLLKIDPAVASGPFITTINDILSLLIYFGLASLMMTSFL